MTLFIAFGSLRDEECLPYDADGLMPSWLALFRGVRTVLESNGRAIYSSNISFLFNSTEVNTLWEMKQADIAALIEFQSYIETCTLEGEQARELLLGTFQDLRRALYFFYGEELGNEAKIRSLFMWMYRVPCEFLSLLKKNNARALCILAHFCVILHRLEYNWWFQGWGTHLIERIYNVLDDGHRFWIRWPIQQIGWIPQQETTHIPYHMTPPKA
jgi:hypothetical protein